MLEPNKSYVSFVSTKAGQVGEAHSFRNLSGSVSDAGEAQVTIDLDSVDTAIEIRDERMRTVLFETEKFPTATLTANVDSKQIERLEVGELETVQVSGELALHGQSGAITLDATIARLDKDRLVVSSTKPVIVSASQFGLAQGIEKLRELAGLPSIASAVPVNFVLAFTRDD